MTLTIIWTCVQLFLLWLAADFLTGMIHWWEDAYGNPNWPILGKYVIQPNLRHHHNPRDMVKTTYWARMRTSIIAGIAIVIILFLCNALSWQVLLFILFSTQGNEIHAAAHRTDKENGAFIVWIQKIGLFQKRKTHGWHHKAPYDTNFFVMTEFLNPLFNKIRFFDRMEQFITSTFGINPLRGSSIRDGV